MRSHRDAFSSPGVGRPTGTATVALARDRNAARNGVTAALSGAERFHRRSAASAGENSLPRSTASRRIRRRSWTIARC